MAIPVASHSVSITEEIRPKLVFFKPFVNRDGFSALEQIVRLYKRWTYEG